VRPIDPGIVAAGELDEPLAQPVGDTVDGRPPGVAVNQHCDAGRPAIAGEQAAHVAFREAEIDSRFSRREFACEDVVEDQHAVLCPAVQLDCLPRLHSCEGDKVAGRLWLTDSLAVHRLSGGA